MDSENLESQPLVRTKAQTGGFKGYSLTDLMAMFLIMFTSMCIFIVIFTLISFRMHWKHESLDLAIIVLSFGIVAFFIWFSVKRLFMTADGATDHFGVWAATLAIACFVAYFGGLYSGWANYIVYMQPYYETSEMNNYRDVNPSNMDGGSFMDAGSIEFVPTTRLDLSKSIGFMNLDMYCVAPIISDAPVVHYDFWAVGINCCSGAPNNFACGDAVVDGTTGKVGSARGGLRLMSVSSLPFFKMAVEQAITRYGINGTRPIFVHWVQDAKIAVEQYREDGWRDFFHATLAAFGGVTFILIVGAIMTVLVKSKSK